MPPVQAGPAGEPAIPPKGDVRTDKTPGAGRGEYLTVAQAHAECGRGGVALLDVRDPGGVADGARRGRATHAVGRLDPAALDPATPVITVCRFGNQSGKAADWLAAGIVVRDMAEGLLLAWRAAGLLLVREDGTPGTVR